MKRNTSGFTLIELLIVIIVVAILSVVVIVGYNGVQAHARNASRATQVRNWVNLFELYKSSFGSYPPVASGNYCLGVNFPLGPDNQGRCRDSAMTDPNYSYTEAGSTALMTEIKKVGTLPTNSPPRVNGDLVGPYVIYWGTGIFLVQAFEGSATDCPQYNMTYSWYDGHGSLLCSVNLGY
jgi:prepilin-type N-terminal cleavage/methylation domain-containing protein